MKDVLSLGLSLSPLAIHREVVMAGVAVGAVALSLTWGGVVLLALLRSPAPRRRVLAWLREWWLPALFLMSGSLLICVGGDGLGQMLDKADMALQQAFIDRAVGVRPDDGVPWGASGDIKTGACGEPALKVLGCPP